MSDLHYRTSRRRNRQEPQLATAFSPLQLLATIFAPATIALTGLFYLSGWSERSVFLQNFGLSIGMFSEPLQATIARGYLSAFLGACVVIAFTFVGWLAMRGYFSRRPRDSNKAMHRLRLYMWNFNRFGYTALLLSVLLLLGLFSGGILGDIKARRVFNALDKSCNSSEILNCARYEIEGSSYTGVLLVQDTQRAAIATKQGVRIISNDKLKSVTPIGPKRKLPLEKIQVCVTSLRCFSKSAFL